MKYGKTVDLVNTILLEYTMPLTLRQIFYRLVANYGYPNTISAYCQLSKQIVRAREREHIDSTKIEDRTREFLGDEGFSNLEIYLYKVIDSFLSSSV